MGWCELVSHQVAFILLIGRTIAGKSTCVVESIFNIKLMIQIMVTQSSQSHAQL